jgi:hypothetical protein
MLTLFSFGYYQRVGVNNGLAQFSAYLKAYLFYFVIPAHTQNWQLPRFCGRMQRMVACEAIFLEILSRIYKKGKNLIFHLLSL